MSWLLLPLTVSQQGQWILEQTIKLRCLWGKKEVWSGAPREPLNAEGLRGLMNRSWVGKEPLKSHQGGLAQLCCWKATEDTSTGAIAGLMTFCLCFSFSPEPPAAVNGHVRFWLCDHVPSGRCNQCLPGCHGTTHHTVPADVHLRDYDSFPRGSYLLLLRE